MNKAIVMITGMLLAASAASAFDKTFNLTREQFENLQISEAGVVLNNFSLAENDSFMAKGTSKVQVSFSVRNRNQDVRALTVMIVGMSDNDLLWALDAAPMMAMVAGNKTEECNGSAYVPPGTVNQTTAFWIRVVGDF